ncbi:MAG: nicotinate (nicotinamide) nucleotide adenylyltransferase [Desulfobacteraceae bacterium]|nr:MAG: nicotinate (nicotinamide) nucleotide adenylyltransferase [Desulfobacteraceae bacterium]
MRIGLFGGTFDPVHFGHLRSALEVKEACGLDQVALIPVAVPPHKGRGGWAAAEERLRMLEIAIGSGSGLTVSEVEIRRPGPSYTIDTVQHFRDAMPGAEIALIMGLDAFREIETWKSFRQILALVPVIVMSRPGSHAVAGGSDRAQVAQVLSAIVPGEPVEEAPEGFLAGSFKPVTVQHVTALDISSTRIRELVRAGRSIRYLAPAAVVEHIYAKGLYA